MALLAKNSGIVNNWPMPMKRSRDLTTNAIISENTEKAIAPNKETIPTPRSGTMPKLYAQQP